MRQRAHQQQGVGTLVPHRVAAGGGAEELHVVASVVHAHRGGASELDVASHCRRAGEQQRVGTLVGQGGGDGAD